MPSNRTGSVVILGAGPAGLSTGYSLARAGWSVQVYEQAHQIGGLARTVRRDGFSFDIGGHRWFTKKDEINLFLVDLLQDELIMVDRISRIYFDGKFVGYPLRAADVLSQIGPVTGARALGDFATSQVSQWVRRDKKPVVSMEDAYVAQFGRTLYELFFKRYSEKVWGDSCDNLSGDWVVQRSRGLDLFTAVRDAVKRTGGAVESLVEQFMYPAGGFGRIPEKMAEEIQRLGGSVHLGWRVVAAQHDGTYLRGVTVSNGNEERTVTADEFVSSIPMTEMAQILRPDAPTEILDATQELTYRGVITVNLMLNRPSVTNDTWVYVHDPSLSFARWHEPRNWSPAMAPKDRTSLVLEVFCDARDATWQTPDEELCERVERELVEKLGSIGRGEVIGAFAERSADAYPRYGLNYQAPVTAVKAYLRSFPNLSIVGRGGTFRYNNTDHAVETGLIAARNILGEAVLDVDAVNSEREYHEERRRMMAAGAQAA